jgi:three-Cys-motif partner protein
MPRVTASKFFQEQSAHSRVKANIVYKFAIAWAKVVLSGLYASPSAAYVDFFAGPGTYEDGCESTPLLIAKAVVANKTLQSGVRMFFNDAEPSLIQSLQQEILSLDGIKLLRYAPVFSNQRVSLNLLQSLNIDSQVPQFYFLDQFGWSDVKPDLIKRIFMARRCDCAFFVRTSRLIAAVTNQSAKAAMTELFGEDRLLRLRTGYLASPKAKEALVLKALQDVTAEVGAPFFQAFPFRIRHAGSSKQHLIYLGKHERGLSIMKDIMSKISSSDEAGVPVIGFAQGAWSHSLFEQDPISSLVEEIGRVFADTKLTVGDVYTRHHPSNDRFLLKHYQEALRRMESSGLIICEPPSERRPTRGDIITMGEKVTVTFRKPENT